MNVTTRVRCLAAAIALMGTAATAQAADWFPIQVRTTALDGTVKEPVAYTGQAKADQPWQICVALPHMKDPFFVAVDYGVLEEAKRLGVKVQILDAGGYTELNNQVSQVQNCVAGGAKAVVLVGVSYDGMNNLLASIKGKAIVVDAINGMSSKDVGARVLTSPRDEGFRAGEYLAKKHPAGSPEVKVVYMPGPAGAGFVNLFNAGFFEAIKGSAVKVVETKNGDIGKEIQARLIENALQTHKDLNYIVGTAVGTEAAVPLLRAHGREKDVKLISLYLTPGVYKALKAGTVEAADASPVVTTARMAVDTAVRLLQQKTAEPLTMYDTIGKMYSTADINSLEALTVLAPDGFKPSFSYAP